MVWKPHATVAAVIEQNDTFLMVEELIDDKAVINQPAGHLEDNESLIAAAIREVKEETAWDFHPTGVLGIYRWKHPTKHHTHMRTTFTGTVSQFDEQQMLDEGIIRTHWLNRQQLLKCNLRSPLVLRCIDDYLTGTCYPLSLLHDI